VLNVGFLKGDNPFKIARFVKENQMKKFLSPLSGAGQEIEHAGRADFRAAIKPFVLIKRRILKAFFTQYNQVPISLNLLVTNASPKIMKCKYRNGYG
jgi:hypothetical protein